MEENRRRTRADPEYELLDTGIFDDDRYFDVFVEYAKAAPDDILIRITAINRGPDAAPLHLLPTLWFKNVWSWYPDTPGLVKPRIAHRRRRARRARAQDDASPMPPYLLYCDTPDEWLFTENDTNTERIFGRPNVQPYVKDAFDNYLVHDRKDAVNPAHTGTKAAAHYLRQVPAGESVVVISFVCARPETCPRRGALIQTRRSTRRSRRASTKRMRSTIASRPSRCPRTCATSSARRSRACCGASSTTATW